MEPQQITLAYDPATKSSGMQGVSNSEYLLRMHYLLQAAEIVEDPSLKKFYASEIKNIAKRNVLRIDPEIKKRFCKRCNSKIDEDPAFYKLQGRKKSKYAIIECQFCLYRNKVSQAFGSSVSIKNEQTQNV